LLEKIEDKIKDKRLEKLENWIIQIQMKADNPNKLYKELIKEFNKLNKTDEKPITEQAQLRAVESIRSFLK
jgi:hypothetical protein